MTEFLDVGFTNMKKKVLHDKYISVDALFESRSCERSLIIFFIFSYIFRERLESESGSSFYYSWLFEKEMRIFNFVARVFTPPKRERPLLGGEKPWERNWERIYTCWGLVLRIKIRGSNPQKFGNSFLFYSFFFTHT